MKLSVGYPARNDEQAMLQAAVGEQSERRVDETALLEAATLAEAQRSVARTYVDECIQSYLLDFGEATRQHSQIHLGLSPRGLLIWQRVCQAKAFLKGRDFVTPDDVQQTAAPVLGVRLGVEHGNPIVVIHELLDSIAVPEGFRGGRR